MSVALALLTGACLAGWLLPPLMARVDLRRADPVGLIVLWLLTMTGVLLAGITTVILLLVPGHGGAPLLVAALHDCWIAVRHGASPAFEQVTGVLAAVLVAAVMCYAAGTGVGLARQRRRRRQHHIDTMRLVGQVDRNDRRILWIEHDNPLAFSIAGRPGVIVATNGLTKRLDVSAVNAVLEHERAHLVARHHLILAAADALARAFAPIPLFRHAPGALGVLVELAADDAAAHSHGAQSVRAALRTVSGPVPSGALAMADGDTTLRLQRQSQPRHRPRRVATTTARAASGIAAISAPFTLGVIVLLGVSGLVCLTVV